MIATIELLDEGVECPGPAGGRWHYDVAIDGDRWRRGDLFYVFDRRGVPRPFTFQYHYTGTASTICYSRQHFDRQPAGFVAMTPVRRAVDMSEDEMEFRQLAADLLEMGHEHAATKLLATFDETSDGSELERVKRRAIALLNAEDDDGFAT